MSEQDPAPGDDLSDLGNAARTARYLSEMMPAIVRLAQESPDGKTFVEGEHEGQPFTVYLDTNKQTEEQ